MLPYKFGCVLYVRFLSHTLNCSVCNSLPIGCRGNQVNVTLQPYLRPYCWRLVSTITVALLFTTNMGERSVCVEKYYKNSPLLIWNCDFVKMCTELHYIVRNTRSITWRCHVARAGLLTWPVRITSWENCLILRYIAEWGGSVFNTPNNTGAGTLDVTMHPVSHLGLLCGMYDVRVTGDFSHVQSSSRDLGYLARAILITWPFD